MNGELFNGSGCCPACGQPLPQQKPETDGEAFAKFWTVYPRKTGKTAALRAFRKAMKKVTVDHLVADIRLRVEVDDAFRDKNFIMHPATYLNGERWTDEVIPRRPDFSEWEAWGRQHCPPGSTESYDSWKPRVIAAMRAHHEQRVAEAIRAADQ